MGETLLSGNPTRKGRAYGMPLAECFGLPEPPTHVRRTLGGGLLAVSELQSPVPSPGPTSSIGYDDAYQVVVQLRRIRRGLWLNGRFAFEDVIPAGKTYISDLRQEPRVFLRDPWHNVQFYMPIATLKAFAEQNDMPMFAELAQPFLVDGDDPLMRQLARSVMAAFASPHGLGGLLIDAILNAVCINVIGRYGMAGDPARGRLHGLAPWQERRAKELMDEHLDVSLPELATACGLSVAHFSRAFKRSTGTAPHRWQLGRRMKRAQALLTGSTLSITEIALKCGFSSQSHFHASFKEHTGVTPGHWRRAGASGRGGPGAD